MFLETTITTSDGATLYLRRFNGASDFFVVLVHGLFGNTGIFKEYEEIFQQRGISFINVDLRGFGKSDIQWVWMEQFAQDLNEILDAELGLFRGDIYMVGYSMGTIVTSLCEKIRKDDTRLKLFHISPVLFIQKRKILFNLPFDIKSRMDLKLPLRPLKFIRIVWEILKYRTSVNILSSVIFVGKYDFCFDDILPPKNTLHVFQDNHYLLYKNPRTLATMIVNEIHGVAHGSEAFGESISVRVRERVLGLFQDKIGTLNGLLEQNTLQ